MSKKKKKPVLHDRPVTLELYPERTMFLREMIGDGKLGKESV